MEVLSDVFTYTTDEPEVIVRLWRVPTVQQKIKQAVRTLKQPRLSVVLTQMGLKNALNWKPDHTYVPRG